eukprot:5881663-Pleurochrysis_carterae.AAC.4
MAAVARTVNSGRFQHRSSSARAASQAATATCRVVPRAHLPVASPNLEFGDESDSQAGALHATANAILLGERDGLSLTGIRREGDELANASTVVRTSSTTSTDGRASPAPVSKAPEPLASSAIDNRGRRCDNILQCSAS